MRLFAAFATILLVAVPTVARAVPVSEAVVETEPVGHSAAAALDVALWTDPSRPRRAMVVGTDQKGPLETYDLAGRRLQRIDAVYPTGVDARGDTVVATSGRSLRVYSVDRETRRLRQRAVVPTGIVPYGVCLYRPSSDRLYAFVTSIGGRVEQWRLTGRSGQAVRTWRVGTRLDTCVADDTRRVVYVSERRFGISRYRAEPDAGLRRVVIDRAKTRWGGKDGKVTADLEGLAIAGNRLYASSQGSSDFVVYDRVSNAYAGRFRVSGNGRSGSRGVDGCQDSVGIEATSRPLGPRFPNGVFVCQDSLNVDGTTVERENFKLVAR